MSKRIAICSDGTWNTPDMIVDGQPAPTNVTKMALAIAARDPSGNQQKVFYDKGVGTSRFERIRGGALGLGLSQNIEDAYTYLVENYEEGDEIYFFGFSRGAYTVRSAAGLIRKCGLLKKEYAEKFDDAYSLYRNATHPTETEAELFRRTYSRVIRIKFIGVWDTVGALGIPLDAFRFINRRWQFHDVKLSSYVDHAYHALAIDEKRKPFQPAIWEQQPHAIEQGQMMEQVWFPGVHTNVGGGFADAGLSDIAFTWMKDKAEACGLAFNSDYIARNIKPDADGKLRDSRSLLYSLFGKYVRPIGKGKNSNEAVHRSAVERMEAVPKYKPRNLVAYLESGGKVVD